ncbi:MAG: hypothetical protein ACK5HL_04450 [Bacilli bacterium]
MKNKIIKILISLIFITLVIIGAIYIFKNINSSNKTTTSNEVKIEKDIHEFGYILETNRSKFYKKEFENLSNILKKEEIDYEKYATSLSILFVYDLYNLNSKTSKNDIGGTLFIHKDLVDNYVLNVQTTLYNHIENNFKGDRTQVLPEVTNVTLEKIEKSSYEYKDKIYHDSYDIVLNINYKEDLEYTTKVELNVVKEDDDKLYVVELNEI